MTVKLPDPNVDFFDDVAALSRQLLSISARKEWSRFDLLQEVQAVTHRLVTKYGKEREGYVDSVKLAGELMEHYERLYSGEVPSLSSGIGALDALLGGFGSQRVYLIAARPGQGKTSLIVSMKKNMLDRGLTVYMASAEMSRLSIGERLVAQYSELPVCFQKAGMSREDLRRLMQASALLAEKRLYTNDKPKIAVEDIDRDLCELAENDTRPNIVFVDYIQLLRSNVISPKTPRVERLGFVSEEILNLSKKHDLPFVCAAQENRDADKRPDNDGKMSDIRGAGEFEQDAHFVAHIKNERPTDTNEDRIIRRAASGFPTVYKAQLKISKNRTGPTGDVDLIYNAPLMEFGEMKDMYYA